MAVNSVHNKPADPVVQRTDATQRAKDSANRRQEVAQQQSNQTADVKKVAAAKSAEKQAQNHVNVRV
ncbi:MAG TPA: hypothetical protein VF920_06830 [Dongiaceae bacterium]